jgi:hypothetical protein
LTQLQFEQVQGKSTMVESKQSPFRSPPVPRILAGILACACCALTTGAFAVGASKPALHGHKKASHYAVGGMPASARQYYAVTWGVDQLTVKLAESGQLVRFSYRVVDAGRAQAFEDKASSPSLLDEGAHVALSIPVMDKVGPLRQSMPAETGKTYWMMFSNKGNKVHSGHRVSVVIGAIKIDGLIVQ